MKYSIADLLKIMADLRSPEGCPWDKEQTFESLVPYLREESAEYIEALRAGDPAHMCEELGDVLLQVVFHAQLGAEKGWFDFGDVVQSISEKMVRRHPHVFGTESAENSADVLKRWDEIKSTEKAQSAKSVLDGVSKALPGLAYAQKMQKKVEKVGFDWDGPEGAWAKLQEEMGEFAEAWKSQDQDHMEDEFGDILFSAVCVARKLGIDAESAMERANAKFMRRFKGMEALESLQGRSLEELEELWQRVKKAEKQA